MALGVENTNYKTSLGVVQIENACRGVQLLVAGFDAFWSAGLGWPKPVKAPVGAAGAVAGVDVDAGAVVAPPNKLPVAGVVVAFPKRVLPAGVAAGMLPVAPLVVLFVTFPKPKSPGPVAAGVVDGAVPPKRPPAGGATDYEHCMLYSN